MKRAAFGVVFFLLVVPGSVWAAGSRQHTSTHFKLVRADAHVIFRFYRQNSDASSIDRGRVVLHVKAKSGSGTIPGKLRFPVSGSVLEHVRLTRQQVGQRTTCEQKRTAKGKAKLAFTRAGSKIRVRWKSPQARVSFCPGPPTDSALTAKMSKAFSSAKFKGTRLTISLFGHSSEKNGQLLQAGYRWRISLTLARVS